MTAYREHRRHASDWTPQEDDLLLTYAGRRKLASLAQQLGRTPLACRRRLNLHGLSARVSASAHAGMTSRELAAALGVSKAHVQKWIYTGWLRHTRGYGIHKRYISIDPDDVLAFLKERGALLPNLRPTDLAWKEIVQEARADLDRRLISGPAAMQLLCLARGSIAHLKRYVDWPEVALVFGGPLPDYYDRAAVRDWLDGHARYWTTRARGHL